MRYIADDNGYLLQVSFGAMIECNGRSCTEYTGDVPDGYSSLAAWFTKEGDKLHRWHIVEGDLTLDSSAADPEVYVPDPTISMRLLWTNPKPSDAFEAKDVSVDWSGYDFLFVQANTDSAMLPAATGSSVQLKYTESDSSTNNTLWATDRWARISKKGSVTFSDGWTRTTTTSAVQNNRIIPVKIYGVKGVIV